MSFKKMILLSTEKYNALSVKNRENKYYHSPNMNEKNKPPNHPTLLNECCCYEQNNKEKQIDNIGQGVIAENEGIQTEAIDDVKTLKDYGKTYAGDKQTEKLAIPSIVQEKNGKRIYRDTKHEQRRDKNNSSSNKIRSEKIPCL